MFPFSILGSTLVDDVSAARDLASQRSFTLFSMRALANMGQIVVRCELCKRSVSAALHAAG